MRQVKTVICEISHSESFDKEVNRLLSEGWTLRKREIQKINGDISEAFNAATICVLYAELERFVMPFEEITL